MSRVWIKATIVNYSRKGQPIALPQCGKSYVAGMMTIIYRTILTSSGFNLRCRKKGVLLINMVKEALPVFRSLLPPDIRLDPYERYAATRNAEYYRRSSKNVVLRTFTRYAKQQT